MMKCWLNEVSDFLFPAPVEQDMDGDMECDIPETAPDSDAYSGEVDISGDIPSYLSNKVLEPDDTPKVADMYVRYMGQSATNLTTTTTFIPEDWVKERRRSGR